MSEIITEWEESAIKACSGLKNPEREIRELVEAAKKALRYLHKFNTENGRTNEDMMCAYEFDLESALQPFLEREKSV